MDTIQSERMKYSMQIVCKWLFFFYPKSNTNQYKKNKERESSVTTEERRTIFERDEIINAKYKEK